MRRQVRSGGRGRDKHRREDDAGDARALMPSMQTAMTRIEKRAQLRRRMRPMMVVTVQAVSRTQKKVVTATAPDKKPLGICGWFWTWACEEL
jgi:hypothetical protein